MESSDHAAGIRAQVEEAHASGRSLRLRGGDTRAHLGRTVVGEVLDCRAHRGIVDYAPAELVVSARAGTPLVELERALAAERQMLAFEPPRLGPGATLGGAIACGHSGPRRPWAGAARDFVLGVVLVDGRGQQLAFGGRVMKNVAGYDVARLMCGAQGTLGVLLEISLKVLPRPEHECTLVLECDEEEAILAMNRYAGQALPLTGAAWEEGVLRLRLGGAASAVNAAAQALGGELSEDTGWWRELREQHLWFFRRSRRLWRIAVPPTTPPLALEGAQLIDWGGAQRWLHSEADAGTIRACAAAAGGHATLVRGSHGDEDVLHPLPQALLSLQRELRRSFDPKRILNPGRLYREL